MYEVLRAVSRIAPKLPRWLRRVIAVAVGSLAWALAAGVRSKVAGNVAQVLGSGARSSLSGRLRIQLITRRIFCTCVGNYFELFALPGTAKEKVLSRIDVRGLEHFQEALALGRGVIIFSAHLGPFEYLTSWFPANGCEMTIPVEKVNDKRMLQLMLNARLSNDVKFIPLEGSAAVRAMLGALKRNQAVLITADRFVAGEAAVMDFFGAPASLPLGPVHLSVLTGAPLIGGFGWRDTNGRDVIELTGLSMALDENQRRDPKVLQNAVARQLEKIIGEHIDQWVVFEPIWRKASATSQQHASAGGAALTTDRAHGDA